jgi:hypothetical protein
VGAALFGLVRNATFGASDPVDIAAVVTVLSVLAALGGGAAGLYASRVIQAGDSLGSGAAKTAAGCAGLGTLIGTLAGVQFSAPGVLFSALGGALGALAGGAGLGLLGAPFGILVAALKRRFVGRI